MNKLTQYTLDRLSLELPTRFIGKKFIFFKEIDSTNNFARELFLEKMGLVPEGAAIVAETQTKGRGQFDRSWHSPGVGGVYMTVVLVPPLEMAKTLPAISLMAGAAVVETLEALFPIKLSLKYPNDIYYHGKKVGGILTESLGGMKYGLQSHFVILGIGVNLYTGLSSFPEEIKETASSLFHLSGHRVEPLEFIREFCIQLEKWYEFYLARDFRSIVDCWKERLIEMPEEAKRKLKGLME